MIIFRSNSLAYIQVESQADRVALFDEPIVIEGSKRTRRGNTLYKDFYPSSVTPALAHVYTAIEPQLELPAAEPPIILPERYTTEADEFGLYRVYPYFPTHDPYNIPAIPETILAKDDHPKNLWTGQDAPFPNITSYRVCHWANSGPVDKTEPDVDRFVHDIIMAEDFEREHLASFRLNRANKAIDTHIQRSELIEDGWTETSVKLRPPAEGLTRSKEEAFPEIEVEGLYYRSLVGTIKTTLQSNKAHTLHCTPHKEIWQPTADSEPQRVYGELYTADAWIEAHKELESSFKKDDGIENVLLPLMFWSDSTHLTNFGSASLWPLYMFFGGHSKYTRAKPTTGVGHHLAYIPSLPKQIQDIYVAVFGMFASSGVITHLKRELIHAVLLVVLLNPEFIEAYREGILITCVDNIIRRYFPRFLTYSADYPEKCVYPLEAPYILH